MLQNDRWIAEQAALGMITPFEPSLIRELDSEGRPRLFGAPCPRGQYRRVMSYGASSFGYDIRLSPKDFRVFRHIPGAVVDPKNFNPRNLEPAELQADDNGEFFIIPGNSYGLGVAVERLNVPRNVTVVCMGKSSYARCFTGATKVKLVDGDYTFLQLMERHEKGERLYGYGVLDGKIVVQELIAPRKIERSRLVRVTLDSGESIDCTPDHKFMLRDGRMIEAQHLTGGMSLRPIYEHDSHGYRSLYDSVAASAMDSRKKAWSPIHKMVMECLVRNNESSPMPVDYSIHHVDGNTANNHPSNLQLMSRREHAMHHNQEDLRHLKGGEGFRTKYRECEEFRQHINKHWHSDASKKKANENCQAWKRSEENKENLADGRRLRWSDPDQHIRQSGVAMRGIGALKRRADITSESLTSALLEAGTLRGAARILNTDRSAFRRFPDVIERFKKGELQYNHKVESVEHLSYEDDTYCLTAPETGNFALAAGVFVSNCAIIANVTPAEAMWRGHLTLEFSNSSPADCRIYANEGVVQLLFFTGAGACEVSYEDRAGKYQDQPEEIVFARA